MPSRLVSIFKSSSVRLSTPVARMPKWPAARIAMSRTVTLRQRLSAIALSAAPGASARGRPCSASLASTKSTTADQARPENRDIVDAFAPDQAVVPVIMPEILVALERPIRLCRIIPAARRCQNDCTRLKIERDKTLEPDRVADVDACSETHDAAACCSGG